MNEEERRLRYLTEDIRRVLDESFLSKQYEFMVRDQSNEIRVKDWDTERQAVIRVEWDG